MLGLRTIIHSCAFLLIFAFAVPNAIAQHAGHHSAKRSEILKALSAGPTVGDYLTCVRGCNELFPNGGEPLVECIKGCSKTSSPSEGVMQSLSKLGGRNPANTSGGVLGVGRPGLNYSCDSETSECTCKGVFDCINMGGSKDCDANEPVMCTDTECTCQWVGH